MVGGEEMSILIPKEIPEEITVSITRKEFLTLPMETRRRLLAKQADQLAKARDRPMEGFKVSCKDCGRELEELGALLFSPPDKDGRVKKEHICIKCYVLCQLAKAREIVKGAAGRRPDLPSGKDFVDDVRHGDRPELEPPPRLDKEYESFVARHSGELDRPDREKILHEICCACVHKPLVIREGLFRDSPRTYEGCGCYQNLEGKDYCSIAIKCATQISALFDEEKLSRKAEADRLFYRRNAGIADDEEGIRKDERLRIIELLKVEAEKIGKSGIWLAILAIQGEK